MIHPSRGTVRVRVLVRVLVLCACVPACVRRLYGVCTHAKSCTLFHLLNEVRSPRHDRPVNRLQYILRSRSTSKAHTLGPFICIFWLDFEAGTIEQDAFRRLEKPERRDISICLEIVMRESL